MSGIDETEGKKNKYRVEGFICRAVTMSSVFWTPFKRATQVTRSFNHSVLSNGSMVAELSLKPEVT